MIVNIQLDCHLLKADLSPQDNVEVLKEAIYDRYGIPLDDQKSFKTKCGDVLENHDTISGNNFLTMSLKTYHSAMISVSVLLPNGTTFHKLSHKLEDILYLKHEIAKKIIGRVENLVLKINNRVLADRKNLYQCGVGFDTQIICTKVIDGLLPTTNCQLPPYQPPNKLKLQVLLKECNKRCILICHLFTSINFLKHQIALDFHVRAKDLVLSVGNDIVDGDQTLLQCALKDNDEITCTLKPGTKSASIVQQQLLNQQKQQNVNAKSKWQQVNVAANQLAPPMSTSNISNQTVTNQAIKSLLKKTDTSKPPPMLLRQSALPFGNPGIPPNIQPLIPGGLLGFSQRLQGQFYSF